METMSEQHQMTLLLCILDPGVHFICGLSDVGAIIDETAELTCKLSSEDCHGTWFRDGKKVRELFS